MDDTPSIPPLPADVAQLRALVSEYREALTQQKSTIAALTRQRDDLYLKNLQLEVRLAQALKQAFGPRADRIADAAQMMLDFGHKLDALPVQPEEPAADVEERRPPQPPAPRRLATRGRRDIAALTDLPMVEHTYELAGELCRCPHCAAERRKIGAEVSYTIEYLPARFLRVKHIQCKYACPACEQKGDNPNIELAPKGPASPIDKGMPGPGLLAYIATAKYADYLPLHRLQAIFARQGFELDRSTMCYWMADVAALVRPVYDVMAQGVRQSHVLATDDTVMPLLEPEKTRRARMWIYLGDESQPYNVFDFTISRSRDGPARFLKDYRQVLLADAYGGYDGIVVSQDLPRAGCWAHARRKFVEAEATAPDLARTILRRIKALFAVEAGGGDLTPEERVRLRQENSAPVLAQLHALFVEQKAQLLPKHPMALAINYALNQWTELTLFAQDGAVPLHNNLAEQEMKRIALLRKNALFVGSLRGGETAAILSSITSTCRRHEVDPQAYLAQLLGNSAHLPADLREWLPDRWKIRTQPQPAPK